MEAEKTLVSTAKLYELQFNPWQHSMRGRGCLEELASQTWAAPCFSFATLLHSPILMVPVMSLRKAHANPMHK